MKSQKNILNRFFLNESHKSSIHLAPSKNESNATFYRGIFFREKFFFGHNFYSGEKKT